MPKVVCSSLAEHFDVKGCLTWTPTGWVDGTHHAAQLIASPSELAFIPGFVNAHSHAFQHAMRGRTESATPAEDDFWSWRNAMYSLALTLEPQAIYEVSLAAYKEMAAAGITHVGEFHYVHHAPDGSRYEDDNELAHQVIRAAQDAGLRITLLLVAYHRAGFGRPAEAAQRRFVEPSLERYLGRVDRLLLHYKDVPGVSIGVAPHSIRAVPGDWLTEIAGFAATREIPLHIHANEQTREITESIAEYGHPPILVFEDLGLFEAHTTLVHGTHLSDDELAILEQRRPVICACPTTERNLGDGFLPALKLIERNVPIALGSDSHAQIDFLEEMRAVEYHERLRYQRRNVLAHSLALQSGQTIHTGDVLLPMANINGAHALGQKPNDDFVAFDLNHPSLQGWTRDSLSSHLTLAGRIDAVAAVVAQSKIIFQRTA